MAQKQIRVQKRTLKKSHKMFRADIYLHIYLYIYLFLRKPTGNILYSASTFRRMRWILWIHHKKCTEFCFWGELFQLWFSSCHLLWSLLFSTRQSRYLCFSIFVLYFSSMSVFLPLYDLYIVSKTKTYKLSF